MQAAAAAADLTAPLPLAPVSPLSGAPILGAKNELFPAPNGLAFWLSQMVE